MTTLRTEKLIAYLALFSGLLISGVAEFYSIVGLTAIFPTAFIPIVIMGIALGIGKLVATVWLKQNWSIAPYTIRIYLLVAIFTLMFITSMGIFGFLSKAHSDQGLVSGDVQSKIAIYDEKIKTAKENIEANRRQLKQMDEAVDQVMARSTTEQGADKSNAIRRSQQRDRVALAKDIEANQKLISALNDEAAPIRAEVRKVEAEVGPIKYIAKLVYEDNPDANILEKAVSWVIILIVVVFDPMAVVLLLSSQISFQRIREQEETDWGEKYFQGIADDLNEAFKEDPYVANVGEKPTAEELAEINAEGDSPEKESDIVSTATVTEHHPDTHPYLRQGFKYPANYERVGPMVYRPEPEKVSADPHAVGWAFSSTPITKQIQEYREEPEQIDEPLFVQNEEQKESDLWTKTAGSITPEEYNETALSRQELTLQEWIGKIKRREITMADVPEHMLLEIRARM